MIGLDTNVLVRYIVQDVPAQARQATTLIQGCYAATRDDTVAILDRLSRTRTLRLENMDVIGKAVRVYAASRADFADCLIEASGSHVLCSHTATFDANAPKTAGMQLIR